jgi:peptide/nickel transport system permease protein
VRASVSKPHSTQTISLGNRGQFKASQSLVRLAWRRFRAHRMALVGLGIFIAILLYVTLGSLVYSEEYANDLSLRLRWEAPSAEHPMGADEVGRDVLARTIYGGQISLAISITAVLVTTLVGTALGLLAGYYVGLVDSIIMRFTEALLAIPLLFLLLVLSKFIGGQLPEVNILGRAVSGSVLVIVLVLGFTTWMGLARLVRANVLSLKEQEFIVAARAIGVRNPGIIFRHILPNTLAPIIVSATLGISNVILAEAYVSFLGLGVQPPTASWGNMIQRAVERIDTAWWLWFFPGMLILLTVLSVNFIGDGLRDALDPFSTK